MLIAAPLIGLTLLAANEPISFTTKMGKRFNGVTVVKCTVSGVVVKNSAGMTFIKFSELPSDLAIKIKGDYEASMHHQKQQPTAVAKDANTRAEVIARANAEVAARKRQILEIRREQAENVKAAEEARIANARYITMTDVKNHHARALNSRFSNRDVVWQRQWLKMGRYDDYFMSEALQYNIELAIRKGELERAEYYQIQLMQHQAIVARKEYYETLKSISVNLYDINRNLGDIDDGLNDLNNSVDDLNRTLRFGF